MGLFGAMIGISCMLGSKHGTLATKVLRIQSGFWVVTADLRFTSMVKAYFGRSYFCNWLFVYFDGVCTNSYHHFDFTEPVPFPASNTQAFPLVANAPRDFAFPFRWPVCREGFCGHPTFKSPLCCWWAVGRCKCLSPDALHISLFQS